MKRHFLFLTVLLIFLLGCLAWCLWSYPKITPLRAHQDPKSRIASNAVQNLTSGSGQNMLYAPSVIKTGHLVNAMLYRNPNAMIPVKELIAAGVTTGEIKKGILDAENGQPIDFYGKVVDQYGVPVAGAKMRGNILLNAGLERSASKDYYTETDGDGLFEFTGLHGVSFGTEPQKPGYEYNPLASINWTKGYKLDAKNPIIFTMWKLKGAEPMVHQDIRVKIPCDGTSTGFDLLTGKKVENGGDLIVSFTRNPVNIDRSKPFDWNLKLEIIEGGLIEVANPYPYLAPENGYKSLVVVDMPVGKSPNWSPSFDQLYYVKIRGGQAYARIKVHLMGNYQPPPTNFMVEVYVNPAGSRNLEWDPAKEIQAK